MTWCIDLVPFVSSCSSCLWPAWRELSISCISSPDSCPASPRSRGLQGKAGRWLRIPQKDKKRDELGIFFARQLQNRAEHWASALQRCLVWVLGAFLQNLLWFEYIHGLAHLHFHFAEQRLRHLKVILTEPKEWCHGSFSSPKWEQPFKCIYLFCFMPFLLLVALQLSPGWTQKTLSDSTEFREIVQTCRVSRVNAHHQGCALLWPGQNQDLHLPCFFWQVPIGEMIFYALAVGLWCRLSLGGAQLITCWRGLWHRAGKALIISNKPICQAEVVPASGVLAHMQHSHRGKGRWMTEEQISSLFPWLREMASEVIVWKEQEHALGQVCRMGATCLGAAGWSHTSHLPAPHTETAGCFLAAFPPPLWFTAARRLCMWRWHKSHQKERRKFAFTPLLAYWMQLSSSLLKPWAGSGREGQALALVISVASAGLAALPEEAPMASNSPH